MHVSCWKLTNKLVAAAFIVVAFSGCKLPEEQLPGSGNFITIDSYSSLNSGAGVEGKGIAADKDGNLYAIGLENTQPGGTWLVRKSADLGKTWLTVDTFRPTNATPMVYTIAIDSENSIYVGGTLCTHNSNGSCTPNGLIRKSSDGGLTWATVDQFSYTPSVSGQIGVLALAVDSSDRVFAAGHNGGWFIRRSLDRGVSWSNVDFIAGGSVSSLHVDRSGNIFAAGFSRSGTQWKWMVRKSVNAGGTWQTLDNYSRGSGYYAIANSISVDSSGTIFVAGYEGFNSPHPTNVNPYNWNWAIRKSSDGGASWTSLDPLPISTGYVGSDIQSNATAISIDRLGNLYVAGLVFGGTSTDINGWVIKKSEDGGNSWETVFEADNSGQPNSMIATDDGIYVTGTEFGNWITRSLKF